MCFVSFLLKIKNKIDYSEKFSYSIHKTQLNIVSCCWALLDTNRSKKMNYLRMKELCEKTSLSRSYVYLLIKEKKFPKGIKIGRVRVWEEREVIDFLSQKRN